MRLVTRYLILASMLCLMVGTVSAGPTYVGPEGCSNCHKDEYADWQRSKHARAFELLQVGKANKSKKMVAELETDKDYTTDKKCLKCHTTGYNEPGGFKDLASTPQMAGLSCEACHGPGSEYRSIHKEKRLRFTRDEVRAVGQTYGSVDPKVCQRCHGHEDSPFTPSVDPQFTDNVDELINNKRGFHKLYELDGEH